MSVSPAFARTLAAGRASFNARVAAARRAQSGFEPQDFASILTQQLDPIVTRAETEAPECVTGLVDAGFDIALVLAARNLAGPRARQDVVSRLWRDVAPALARSIAPRPRALLGSLTNAALNIAATPGARSDEWLALLAAAAPVATADTLLPIGQVLAWRAGMAHYREGALAAADSLPPEVALSLFGGQGDWAEVRARFAANRWWRPDPQTGSEGVTVGDFTGFGGPFPQPPLVRAGDGGFVVRSGERTLLLVADAYGATLHPAPAEAFDRLADRPAQLDAAGVMAGDRSVPTPQPRQGLSTAWDETLGLAVVSAWSHRILVTPWRRP